ncbi:MAG: hypothetical protein NW223_06700 [Hyphomicrobiaceae bacterium]|nr:hypothetical protein [Hyphomicrobiaceae bacterium]
MHVSQPAADARPHRALWRLRGHTGSVAGAALVLLVLAVYYGAGVPFLYYPDSAGYLAQGLSLLSDGGYQRSASRALGYPAVLAAITLLPRPALAMVLVQALAAACALVLLFHHCRAALPALVSAEPALARAARTALPLWLCAAASYSALHNFIAAMLPEILFATLALLSLVGVHRVLRAEALSWRGLLEAVLAALACALPMLLKPHGCSPGRRSPCSSPCGSAGWRGAGSAPRPGAPRRYCCPACRCWPSASRCGPSGSSTGHTRMPPRCSARAASSATGFP